MGDPEGFKNFKEVMDHNMQRMKQGDFRDQVNRESLRTNMNYTANNSASPVYSNKSPK